VVKLSPNKRRSGRARNKQGRGPGTELQNAGPEEKGSEQEVTSPLEIVSDKEEAEPELKSTEPEPILPAQSEPAERQTAELNKIVQSEQKQVDQPPTRQKSGGKRVADNNREGIFENLSKINESVFGLEGLKKAAAWYIETSERFANQALEFQEQATGWAKDTPFGPLFEAQTSMARKFVERSANAARALWQIQPPEQA
jgi:hypothetical protein